MGAPARKAPRRCVAIAGEFRSATRSSSTSGQGLHFAPLSRSVGPFHRLPDPVSIFHVKPSWGGTPALAGAGMTLVLGTRATAVTTAHLPKRRDSTWRLPGGAHSCPGAGATLLRPREAKPQANVRGPAQTKVAPTRARSASRLTGSVHQGWCGRIDNQRRLELRTAVSGPKRGCRNWARAAPAPGYPKPVATVHELLGTPARGGYAHSALTRSDSREEPAPGIGRVFAASSLHAWRSVSASAELRAPRAVAQLLACATPGLTPTRRPAT